MEMLFVLVASGLGGVLMGAVIQLALRVDRLDRAEAARQNREFERRCQEICDRPD